MTITVTDMFCGAGGSSTGLSAVPGITVKTAMNHWARAIETHNTNHPDVDHICADIQLTDPRSISTTEMLWGSPECTNHSVAKGRKRITNQGALFGDKAPDEAAMRSRATMWDIPAYAEVHDYKIIITENVVDAAKWVMFDAWLLAMKSLDYEHHIVYMNSMHAQLGGLPAPQSRDRMYVMFWKKGNTKPNFDKLRPLAYCPSCDETVRALQVFKKPNERWGRYRAQYNWRCPKVSCRNRIIEPGWRPASDAIDWGIEGQRIGDRPVKDYYNKAGDFIGSGPLAPKTMARILAGLEKYGRQPVAIDAVRGAQILAAVNSEPFQTQTTSYTRGLLVPVEGRDGKETRDISEAMRTQTTRNETGLLMPPLIINNVSGADASRTATVHDPLRTLVGGGNHESLLMPYYGSSKPQGVDQPIGTLTTVDRYAMITLRGQNAPKDVYGPLDTFAANGNHHALMGVNPPAVEDCTFRMLEPHEVTWGMAFPKDYTMTGTKREMVKQAGNAVCPPNARDLGMIAAESLQAA
ncbi:DNA cytosine methyltransferase [Arthrobacter sp. NPDC080073]|uniref:DNA cytosine methyltransferase n=1 Tax=Arthrobacter sp. NPDC080073 TaxID=3155919 RepID=UPI003421B4BA